MKSKTTRNNRSLVIKNEGTSKQTNIAEDLLWGTDGIVEPYLNFDALRGFYAFNVYHKRALKLKALLLSQIESGNLEDFLPENTSPQKFLYKFMLNAETFGSAFFEKSTAVGESFYLYNLSTYTARVDTQHNIFQRVGTEDIPMEGAQFMYDSILSDYYGEPDYIEVIPQIITLHKADQYNDVFFDNGAKPELAIMFKDSDPTDEQIAAIGDFMRKDLRGYKNAHKTLILTTGEGNGENKPDIEIKELGKVEDMSHEKLKKVGRDEIIAAHGVPPRLVGIVEASSLGGGGELTSQLHMFNQITIKPKMALVEAFFAQHGITLKLKEFDATAFKDDADVVTGLVQAGILTAQEAKNVMGWSNGN